MEVVPPLYVHENDRLTTARLGMALRRQRPGAPRRIRFRAVGLRTHRVLHEERFFELAGTVTVEVEFIVTDDEARQLLELVAREACVPSTRARRLISRDRREGTR